MYELLPYLKKIYQKEISILNVIYELLQYSNKFAKNINQHQMKLYMSYFPRSYVINFSSYVIFVLLN